MTDVVSQAALKKAIAESEARIKTLIEANNSAIIQNNEIWTAAKAAHVDTDISSRASASDLTALGNSLGDVASQASVDQLIKQTSPFTSFYQESYKPSTIASGTTVMSIEGSGAVIYSSLHAIYFSLILDGQLMPFIKTDLANTSSGFLNFSQSLEVKTKSTGSTSTYSITVGVRS